jgi:hypothetical protein
LRMTACKCRCRHDRTRNKGCGGFQNSFHWCPPRRQRVNAL